MGNTNSSPRYRSRSPDPALDHTWSNSYPKTERAGNRAWPQPPYPAVSTNMVNGHHSAPYDHFEKECIQHQQSKLSDQQPLRFARSVSLDSFSLSHHYKCLRIHYLVRDFVVTWLDLTVVHHRQLIVPAVFQNSLAVISPIGRYNDNNRFYGCLPHYFLPDRIYYYYLLSPFFF